ncbi:MAG: hypothetical protein ACR2IT_06150, partial [Pirellulales bacterium]
DADIAAYARVDRLLSALGRRDCAVVLGALPSGGPSSPHGGRSSLALLVDGWLQLAHQEAATFTRRRAA